MNPQDGDGAGLLSSIPHKFLKREFQYYCNVELPAKGQYGVGNVFQKMTLYLKNQRKHLKALLIL